MFIKIEKPGTKSTELINTDHIISATYTRPTSIMEIAEYQDEDGTLRDGDGEIARNYPASILIHTTQMVSEEVFNYTGGLIGAIPVSRRYMITGDIATDIYRMLASAPRMLK